MDFLSDGVAKYQKKKKKKVEARVSMKRLFKRFVFFMTETFDLIDLCSNQCFGKEFSHFDSKANPCQLQS